MPRAKAEHVSFKPAHASVTRVLSRSVSSELSDIQAVQEAGGKLIRRSMSHRGPRREGGRVGGP